MNVALAFDAIYERNAGIYLLELLQNLYPEAPIYTLYHSPGKVLGRIESTKIISTYFSGKFEQGEDALQSYALMPLAVSSLAIPADIDLLICVSRGIISGIRHAPNTKVVTYLWGHDLGSLSKSGLSKIIFDKWRKRNIKRSDLLMVASLDLQDKFGGTVVAPALKTDDYYFVREADTAQLSGHFIYTYGLTKDLLRELFSPHFYFFGPVGELKVDWCKANYLGNHCAGDASYQMLPRKSVIDLSGEEVPLRAIGALTAGKPVILIDNKVNRDFIPAEFAVFIKDKSLASINDGILELENRLSSFPLLKMRRFGLSFNGRIFKSRVQKIIDGLALA